jgi:hypothetical protein
MNRNDDTLELIFGILTLLVILLVLGIIWFLIASLIAAIRYSLYLRHAEAEFEQVARECGMNFPGADVIETVHGVGIHPDGGYKNVNDWVAGTLFGTEEYEVA